MTIKGKVNRFGQLIAHFPALALEKWANRDVEIIIRLAKKKRSLPQNSYYWGVICKMVADFTGHTPQEIHEYHKAELWSFVDKFETIMGREIKLSRSTAKLMTAEFAEFCDHLRQWYRENLSLEIPGPNEIPFEAYEQALEGENNGI